MRLCLERDVGWGREGAREKVQWLRALSVSCSSRRLEFSSQLPGCAVQTCTIPVPRDSVPSSGLYKHTQGRNLNIRTYIHKLKKKIRSEPRRPVSLVKAISGSCEKK